MQEVGKTSLPRGNLEVELEAGFEGLEFWNSRKAAGLAIGLGALRKSCERSFRVRTRPTSHSCFVCGRPGYEVMKALSRDVGKSTAGVQEAPSPAGAAGMRVTTTMPTSRMTHLFAFLFERFALLIHMAFSRGAGAGYDCEPFQGRNWRQGKRGRCHTRPGCLRLTLTCPVAG